MLKKRRFIKYILDYADFLTISTTSKRNEEEEEDDSDDDEENFFKDDNIVFAKHKRSRWVWFS